MESSSLFRPCFPDYRSSRVNSEGRKSQDFHMEPRSRANQDRVRPLVLDLWSRTRIDWGFATDRLNDALRKERSLSSHDRREVAETLYGLIRQVRRLDFALDSAGGKIAAGPKRELARYLAYQLLEGH